MFDAKGRYEIEIPEEGTYKVVASAIGFKALEKSVKVDGPGVFRLDFMLSANTEQLKEVVVLSGREVNKVDRTVDKITLTNMENQDRTSVVWGKSVSVRVDIGGRGVL